VGLAGGTIQGQSNVGSIAGYIDGTTSVTSSHATTNIIASKDFIGFSQAGGLIGTANSGTVSNCYFQTGTVRGTGFGIGGLIGLIQRQLLIPIPQALSRAVLQAGMSAVSQDTTQPQLQARGLPAM